jgi:hypothetical protein
MESAVTSARALLLGVSLLGGPALAACSSNSPATADGGAATAWSETTCAAAPPTACTDPSLRWAGVEPIFEQSCAPCHSGAPGAPWPLANWVDVAAWADSISQDLTDCTMPPLDGGVPMTSGERAEILGWLACGAPE